MKITGLLFILLFTIVSCKENEVKAYSGYHLPKNKMIPLLTDIVLAEGNEKVLRKYGYNTNILIDSSYKFIYQSHNIKQWQMDSSFRYYANHGDEFIDMMEAVIENLNRLEN